MGVHYITRRKKSTKSKLNEEKKEIKQQNQRDCCIGKRAILVSPKRDLFAPSFLLSFLPKLGR